MDHWFNIKIEYWWMSIENSFLSFQIRIAAKLLDEEEEG